MQCLRFWDVGVDVKETTEVQSVGNATLMKHGPIASLVFQLDVGKEPLHLCDEKGVACFVGVA